LSGDVGGGSLSFKWRCSWSNMVDVGAGSTVSGRTRWYWFRKHSSGVGSSIVAMQKALFWFRKDSGLCLIGYTYILNRLYLYFLSLID